MLIKTSNGGKYELRSGDVTYEIGEGLVEVPDELAQPLVDNPDIAIVKEEGGE